MNHFVISQPIVVDGIRAYAHSYVRTSKADGISFAEAMDEYVRHDGLDGIMSHMVLVSKLTVKSDIARLERLLTEKMNPKVPLAGRKAGIWMFVTATEEAAPEIAWLMSLH